MTISRLKGIISDVSIENKWTKTLNNGQTINGSTIKRYHPIQPVGRKERNDNESLNPNHRTKN